MTTTLPTPPRASRDLSTLFAPRSVAIVGASADSAKWGYGISRQALSSESDRPLHLVNRGGSVILGKQSITSLRDLDEPVDLVVISVPSTGFLDAVDDALAAGAKALVAITAGLSEAGDKGAAIEQAALDRVRAAGAFMVGPNCLGLMDSTTDLLLTSEQFAPGDITILSQSGNLVIDLDDLMRSAGLGIARFVSLGNQADLTIVDLMHACVDHDGTAAIALYAEDVIDGRGFVEAARALAAAGKPVVLLAPGRSDAATRGAVSHTGSMTSPARVIDAACAAAGIHRVDTPNAMVDLLVALRAGRTSESGRVAILTDGGGHGALAADVCAGHGLTVPRLSEPLRASLMDALWSQSTADNPVDLAGVGEQDPMSYVRSLGLLLASDEVDSVLMTGYFGGYSTTDTSLASLEIEAVRELIAVVDKYSKPVVVQTIFPASAASLLLRDGGIPVHRDVAAAADVISRLVEPRSAARVAPLGLPAPAEPLTAPGYVALARVLADASVGVVGSRDCASWEEVAGAATSMRFPLVLKAMGILHKSDVGGVALGLDDMDDLRGAYDDIVNRLAPPSVVVEEMIDLTDAVELIVGVRRDERFGPVLMVGLGGVYAELLDDVAFALAPIGRDVARELIESLRGAAILKGARGRPPLDIDALCDALARFSFLAAEHVELLDMEINPLAVLPREAVALDARATPAPAGNDLAEKGN